MPQGDTKRKASNNEGKRRLAKARRDADARAGQSELSFRPRGPLPQQVLLSDSDSETHAGQGQAVEEESRREFEDSTARGRATGRAAAHSGAEAGGSNEARVAADTRRQFQEETSRRRPAGRPAVSQEEPRVGAQGSVDPADAESFRREASRRREGRREGGRGAGPSHRGRVPQGEPSSPGWQGSRDKEGIG